MFLKQLELQNFRNFKKISFSFLPTTTLIFGPNTSGKTNILEAIYLLASGHSFRAEVEREMISYGEEIARVGAEVGTKIFSGTKPAAAGVAALPSSLKNFVPPRASAVAETTNLEIILTTGQISGQPAPHKKYLVNGVSKRMIDFLGNLRAVLFWPEDLELVTNSPSIRRKYLDLVLSQVDREYRRSLLSYEKGLRQRNRLLERIRDEGAPRSQLLFWDKLLIKNGGILTDKRQEFIEFVNNWSAGQLDNYHLEYDKSVISETRLAQYGQEEVAAGATLVGPHRDDIKFKLKNEDTSDGGRQAPLSGARLDSSEVKESRDLSIYGSRGEQRLAVLWLKLCELEFISQKTGQRPILLLDDIFSELDHEHRAYVFRVIPQQQTIITTTDLHLVEKSYLKDIKIIEL